MSLLEDRPPEAAALEGMRRSDFLRRTAVAGAAATGAGAFVVAEAQARGDGSFAAGSPLDRRGLHNRINRIDRVVTNVSDAERSKEFWEAATPLRATARTQSPQQPFRNLGISSGRFDGYLLQDLTGGNPVAVHLLEWKDPKPIGTPYKTPLHIGWYRVAIIVDDIDLWFQKVLDAGGEPWSEPADFTPFIGAPGIPVFGVPDPDGITIEFIGVPGAIQPGRVNHVASSTADIDGTRPFFTEVLGLDFSSRSTSCPVPNTLGPDGGEAAYDTTFFRARGDGRFSLDYLTWFAPAAPVGPPYDVFGDPTHRGYHRVSIEVDDIDASYRTLVQAGLSRKGKKGRRLSGPPEEWDFGPEFGGRRKVVVLTSPEGVGFELIQQAPYPTASETAHPFPGPCPPPGSVAIPPSPDRQ